MIDSCPICGIGFNSEDHDVGWYFPCLCGYRLRWVRYGRRLRLEVVPEDTGELDDAEGR